MTLEPASVQWSDDGSLSSAVYGDVYFQRGHGAAESHYVFLEGNHLPSRFRTAAVFRIAELGFGTGLNFLLTCALWKKSAPPGARLMYVSIEKHPLRIEDLRRAVQQWPDLAPLAEPLLQQYPPLVAGFHHIHLPGIHLMLLLGDVKDVLPSLTGLFDAWYLDGFAPARNPEMWQDNLYDLIAQRTMPEGTVATFSAAGAVRRGLAAAGFSVRKQVGFGRKRDMTVATLTGVKEKVHAAPRTQAITVIGAGLAGCNAAFALAQKGYQVKVMEQHATCAAAASGNKLGILYPKLTLDPAAPMGQFHMLGFCYSRALALHLNVSTWTPCGVLHFNLEDEDAQWADKLMAGQSYPPELARPAPEFASLGLQASGSGWFQEWAGYLSPVEFCQGLLRHENIEVMYGQKVESLPAGPVVVACAHGLARFAETKPLPLQSLRGQTTVVKATAESRALKSVVCHQGYLTPEVEGLHHLGATFQREWPPEEGESPVRPFDHQENLEQVARHFPGLALKEITGGRVGYRLTTPDKLPVIGACPDFAAFEAGREEYVADIYISAGFGAHGLSGTALGGAIVASQIAGDPLPIPSSLYAYLKPERFIMRDLKKTPRKK